MKHKYWAFIGILFLVGGCRKEDTLKKMPRTQTKQVSFTKEQMRFTKVQTVVKVPALDEITAVGVVSFDEDNVVRVFPIVSGSVGKVNISLGDYVKQGELLATIISTDISTYQRNHNIAKADYEIAEANLVRATELYKSGMLSAKEFAEAQKDFSNALSEYNEKKQILELYGGSSEQLDALFRVVAPRSGYIVERNINEGTQIRTDNSTNMFTISDLQTVWVWANVHESDMAQVSEGDLVSVKTIAYPDKTFTGTIKKISTMLDPASRVIRVRTELPNENGSLKPEMFATVVISSKTQEKVLAVPLKAMVLENNNFFVMKETTTNTYEKVLVTTGKKFGDFAEITMGLQVGDRIIVEGSLFAITAYNQKK